MPRTLHVDLALQGGGCKGIALNAALAELMSRGHTIGRIVGTSAGAIAASLVAVGYTGEELLELSRTPGPDGKLEFAEYITEPLVPASPDVEPVISDFHSAVLHLPGDLGQRLLSWSSVARFVETGGVSSGEGFVDWFMRKLEHKQRGSARVTLGQLHARTGRHLTIITTDTTSRRLRALNHVTAPDCPLFAAVRMSMSIPLFFAEVRWREEWGPYLGESLAGHVMVDGGLMANLPLRFILPSTQGLLSSLMGPAPEVATLPLGLSIDTSLDVEGAPPPVESWSTARLSHSRLAERIEAMVDTMLLGTDLMLSDASEVPLCRLPAKGYSASEFDMSLPRAEALLASAKKTMADYLDALDAT